MDRCAMEMCARWTGQGCISAVLDLEPDVEAFEALADDENTEDED